MHNSNANNTQTGTAETKCVLVTGGSKRIGAVTVRLLHQAGYNIIIHCHSSRQVADDLAQELMQSALIPQK